MMSSEMLDTLILNYAEHNEKLNDYKKLAAEENKRIKQELGNQMLTEYQVNNVKVVVSTRKTETLNEEMLLGILKTADITTDTLSKVVKTKEYIDMDALESVIYKGEIPEDVVATFDVCREVKETQVLNIKEVKQSE